jgi:hypothetical protein
MIRKEIFDKVVSELISTYSIEEIKKSPAFVNIPKEYWKKYENQKLKLRVNQEYVLKLLKEDGITTGIHCQATGCGKSYIILMYCNYFKKYNLKGNIIIFTERVNILKDFFDLDKKEICPDKKKFWKDNDLINLDDFGIINRVTSKQKDWHDILKETTIKPKILLINRAFLTLGEKYKDLNEKHVGMIIHDECHNTSSEMCYKLLLYFKSLNVPIVGFSATPLRAGKTSNELNKDRLLNVYGNNGELQILSNFNMMYAIKHQLILPPNFIWYELPKVKLNEEDKLKEINKKHVITVFSTLDEIIPTLPNKKIIAWCGTIEMADKWYEVFNNRYEINNNGRIIGKEFSDFTYCIDHSKFKSKQVDDNYEYFKQLEGNCILFCADKHREGSDIKNLDCCIFMDFVKNRGSIPFIQSIGRVLRIENKEKQQGVVIDCFISNSEAYDKELVEKIIGYYVSFENLSDNDIQNNKYEKYNELRANTKFDVDNQQIQFTVGDKTINIDCKNLAWNNIQDKFDPMLQNKIKLSACDNLRSKAKILKSKFGFNANSDFLSEYENISEEDKLKYNLPNIDDEEYLNIFNSYSWFDILDIQNDFIKTQNEAKKQLLAKGVILNKPRENWSKWCKLIDNLPIYPKYVWGDFNYDYFKDTEKQIFF